jgi:hypothetical protein
MIKTLHQRFPMLKDLEKVDGGSDNSKKEMFASKQKDHVLDKDEVPSVFHVTNQSSLP